MHDGKAERGGGSGHILHVVGSVTLTELRDAQVLSGFIKLQNRQTATGGLKTLYAQVNPEDQTDWTSDHLVAVVGSLDGNLLDLLADAELTLGEIGPMTGTNDNNQSAFRPFSSCVQADFSSERLSLQRAESCCTDKSSRLTLIER